MCLILYEKTWALWSGRRRGRASRRRELLIQRDEEEEGAALVPREAGVDGDSDVYIKNEQSILKKNNKKQVLKDNHTKGEG